MLRKRDPRGLVSQPIHGQGIERHAGSNAQKERQETASGFGCPLVNQRRQHRGYPAGRHVEGAAGDPRRRGVDLRCVLVDNDVAHGHKNLGPVVAELDNGLHEKIVSVDAPTYAEQNEGRDRQTEVGLDCCLPGHGETHREGNDNSYNLPEGTNKKLGRSTAAGEHFCKHCRKGIQSAVVGEIEAEARIHHVQSAGVHPPAEDDVHLAHGSLPSGCSVGGRRWLLEGHIDLIATADPDVVAIEALQDGMGLLVPALQRQKRRRLPQKEAAEEEQDQRGQCTQA
mmetsp:Transcript_42120/g.111212  ORF Transcript_42120/g.111212 Transcript_42120/m.111212 type:complete len:283 (-) Transcript_42120:768-1616(-)